MKNSGSSVFFFALFILSWFIFTFVAILSLCSTKMNSLKKKIKRQLVWKQSLIYFISQFSPLIVCSALNIYDLTIDGNVNVVVYSAYISMFAIASGSTVLLLLFLKVWCLSRKLNFESVQEFNFSFSPLTESLKETVT